MTSGENMLGFKPITTSSSELCGASVMTDIFVNMLQDKVKSILNGSVSFDEHYCDKLARNWETNIMRRFRRGVSKTWTFPLPEDSLEAGTSRATYARWRQNQGLQLFRYVLMAEPPQPLPWLANHDVGIAIARRLLPFWTLPSTV